MTSSFQIKNNWVKYMNSKTEIYHAFSWKKKMFFVLKLNREIKKYFKFIFLSVKHVSTHFWQYQDMYEFFCHAPF